MFPRPIPRPLPLAATERKERDQSGWEFSRYGQSLASALGGKIHHYRCIWFTLEGKGRDIHPCVQTQKKTGKSQVFFFTYYPLLCFLRQKLSLISSLTCRLNWLASMLVSAWGYKQVSSCMDWAHIVILYSKLFIHWAILYTTPALNLFLKLSNTYI